MQGLIAVRFGYRHIVLESVREWFVHAMHHTERPVAVINVVHHDTQPIDIHDLAERLVPVLHLAVDRIEVLFSTIELGVDVSP